MPWAELEPTIPVFEREKIIHALDRAATVIGTLYFRNRNLSWMPERRTRASNAASHVQVVTDVKIVRYSDKMWWIWKYLEDSRRGLTVVLSGRLTGGPEENRETPVARAKTNRAPPKSKYTAVALQQLAR
jgi:hypothetical protein